MHLATDTAQRPPASDYLLISEQVHGQRVLDFSNSGGGGAPERGGYGPDVPQIITRRALRGPLVVGHTWDADDPREKIYTDPRDTVQPGESPYIEARCHGCVTRPVISQHPSGTLLVIEHERGCRVLRRMLRTARRPG